MATEIALPSFDMADSPSPSMPSHSPPTRSESPSPSISPSMAIGAVPELDRCVSEPSTISSPLSSRSVSASSDAGLGSSRRRGYMRPQGTAFSDSARNRDSVMSLGSIAHMQYYFARTGLLDGKGGQLAKKRLDSQRAAPLVRIVRDDDKENDFEAFTADLHADGQEPLMLPPTVSTYRAKVIESQPPPDIATLRRELSRNLDSAMHMVEDTLKIPDSPRRPQKDASGPPNTSTIASPDAETDTKGYYELQGLQVLDTVTLAIRSAKDYYTFHNQPQALFTIRSERELRSDLYQVLDVLKRMVNRNFRGGMRETERAALLHWIGSIADLLQTEQRREMERDALRKQWVWLQGDWSGREREREWEFLKSFDTLTPEALPAWTEVSSDEAPPFLKALSSGLRLVHLHNELVKQSLRRFGGIKTYYTDLNKPYRCAENLRYWIKAAELRWEIRLKVDVLDIVYARGGAATWRKFEDAVLQWSQAVRKEISDECLGVDGSGGGWQRAQQAVRSAEAQASNAANVPVLVDDVVDVPVTTEAPDAVEMVEQPVAAGDGPQPAVADVQQLEQIEQVAEHPRTVDLSDIARPLQDAGVTETAEEKDGADVLKADDDEKIPEISEDSKSIPKISEVSEKKPEIQEVPQEKDVLPVKEDVTLERKELAEKEDDSEDAVVEEPVKDHTSAEIGDVSESEMVVDEATTKPEFA